MTFTLAMLIFLWGFPAFIILTQALLHAYIPMTEDSKQWGARWVFLAPIWPVVIVARFFRGIFRLWKTADW